MAKRRRRAMRWTVPLAVSVTLACGQPAEPSGAKPLPVTAITLGNAMACARLAADASWGCWGLDEYQRFGLDDGYRGFRSFTPLVSPVRFTQVVVGGLHVCALDADGFAWCWGNNGAGESGTGALGGLVGRPTKVQGAARFGRLAVGSLWGAASTCGVTVGGDAYCWGDNAFGQLGTGDTLSRVLPTRVEGLPPLRDIALASRRACALDVAGNVWCWGDNSVRQIADSGASRIVRPARSGGDLRFHAVALGAWATCGIALEGPTYCWGWGRGGTLGPNAPRDPSAVPQLVTRDTVFVDLISENHQQFFGLTRDGTVYRWGDAGCDCALAIPIVAIKGLRFASLVAGRHTSPLSGTGMCGVTVDQTAYCAGAMHRELAMLTADSLVAHRPSAQVPFPEGER